MIDTLNTLYIWGYLLVSVCTTLDGYYKRTEYMHKATGAGGVIAANEEFFAQGPCNNLIRGKHLTISHSKL